MIEPHELHPWRKSSQGRHASSIWCVIGADNQTLRDRMAGRGWPGDLVSRAVADAHALRAAEMPHRIDTTHDTPEDAMHGKRGAWW